MKWSDWPRSGLEGGKAVSQQHPEQTIPIGKPQKNRSKLPNLRHMVQHTQRVELQADHLSCSSKNAHCALIRYDRQPLEDYRPHSQHNGFGRIYCHFRTHDEHPTYKPENIDKLPRKPLTAEQLPYPNVNKLCHPTPEEDPAPIPVAASMYGTTLVPGIITGANNTVPAPLPTAVAGKNGGQNHSLADRLAVVTNKVGNLGISGSSDSSGSSSGSHSPSSPFGST